MSPEIKENVPLAPLTTLRIGGNARYFVEVSNERELRESLDFAKEKSLAVFVLGGGSNILFADAGFDGLVIRPRIMGISPLVGEGMLVRVGAGEVLDDVVAWTVEQGFWGMENLSFIPGLTGALAIQNVGAYGQEASEVIESVEVMDRANYEFRIMNNEECGFTYRHSRFNTSDKGRFIILSITLRLRKSGKPNLKYKDLTEHFNSLGCRTPKLGQVREAVIEIRKGKGQDPSEVWSAGSFFSNFKLTHEEFEGLCKKVGDRENELRDLVKKIAAPSDNGMIKMSAAWILDQLLGLKGTQVGGAKLSDKQVLNMINVGNATASDCIELFEKTRALVLARTGLTLVNEPEFVGL